MQVYSDDRATNPVEKPFLKKYLGAILLLASLTVAAYGWAALTPSIFGDEWGYLATYINAGAPAYPEGDVAVRPFGLSWLALTHRLVGANMSGYHLFGALINFISALLLLVTLDILLPGWPAYNGAVAALYLVFPADVTRLWLAGNTAYGSSAYLAAAVLMALFWRDGRWWAWLAGMLLSLIALGTYETGIGVMMALSGIAFLFGRHRTWPQRLGLLAPALAAVAFAAARWQWQLAQGSAFGHSTGNVATSPLILLYRQFVGARYILFRAWRDVVLGWLPLTAKDGFVALTAALAVLVGLVAAAILIAHRISRNSGRFDPADGREVPDAGRARSLAIAGAVGLLIMAAGYVPIITVINPGPEFEVSRSHHLPGIGAALFIGAVLFGLGWWLGDTPKRARFIALAGIAPLLLLGVAGQLVVARQTNQSWADQKLIWRSLIEQAPDIAPGTHILLLLDGYDHPGKGPRPIISGPFGATAALQLLYGRDELSGTFVVGGPSQALDTDGDELIVNSYRTFRYPAAETLVFSFSRTDRELVQVEKVEKNGEVLSLGLGRILDTPAIETDWRWLVAD